MDRQVAAQFRNEILAAAGASGVTLAYNRLRQLTVRAIRDGHVRNVVRQLQTEARYPRTASTLARGIGIGRPVRETPEPRRLDFDNMLAGEYDIGAKRRKTSRDPSGSYVQLRREKATAGKVLGEVDKLSKLIHAHAGTVIERFQHVTNINDGSGGYPLSYVTDGDQKAFPMYLFDLTSIKNVFGTGTTSASPYPLYRMFRETAGASPGRYIFNAQLGRTNANATSPVWQEERKPALITSDAKERALLEWFDIRMVLYGATTAPTWIEVAIVQFNEDEMVPLLLGDLGATASYVIEPDTSNYGLGSAPATAQYNRWQTGWQGEADRLIGSTISFRSLNENAKFMTYKFKKTFTFNPTGAEDDPSGHQVQFELKYLMNKVCDYVGNPTEWDEVSAANEVNPNIWPAFDTHKFSCVPPAKGREFLMIRAFTPTLDPSPVPTKACSFDLMVRRKRTHIRS